MGPLPGPVPMLTALQGQQDGLRRKNPRGERGEEATAAPSSPSGHAQDCAVAVDTVSDVTVCPLLAWSPEAGIRSAPTPGTQRTGAAELERCVRAWKAGARGKRSEGGAQAPRLRSSVWALPAPGHLRQPANRLRPSPTFQSGLSPGSSLGSPPPRWQGGETQGAWRPPRPSLRTRRAAGRRP